MIDLAVEWRQMQQRIMAQLEGKQSADMNEAVTEVDGSVYTDPERFERERKHIFHQQPILAALSSELAEPGQRVCFDCAGVPVLVIRGDDGKLRAFLNICTHRGSKLVQSDEQSKLVCPYHGWAFNSDGSLKGIPNAEAFDTLDRKSKSLAQLPVAEWHGLVFIIATPGEQRIDIEDWLGDMAPLMAALKLDTLQKNAQDQLDVGANWKLALDTGREIYHVPVTHKNTLAKNLLPNIMIVDAYGRHNRYCGASKDFLELKGKPEQEWPPMHYQAVHYIYPNTTLSITHSFDGKTPMVSITRIFPGQSVGEASSLLSTWSNNMNEAHVAVHDAVVNIVDSEDYVQARHIWNNLQYQPNGFKLAWGRNESLLQHCHSEIAGQIGMPL